MKPEERYESWKKRRAIVRVPDGFAERVMTSVCQTRRLTAYLFLQSLIAATGRSKFVRAGICSLALVVWAIRIGSILTIFVPR